MRRYFVFLLVFGVFGGLSFGGGLKETAMSPPALGEIEAKGWLKD